jgi:hypothetical protein
MANLGNTTRPAYVYDAETDTWLPIGVGAHSHDQIPASIVDAKGDLIVGTAADTVQKRTVGADGSYLVADSTQTTGLNWAGPSTVAGKNVVINGGFDFWQRGTTITSTSGFLNSSYLADRWYLYYYGGGNTSNYTASQQAQTPGAIPGCETQYYIRHAFPASNATAYWETFNRIEDVRTFAGQTVTISFWYRNSSSTIAPNIEIMQNFGTSGSTAVYSYPGPTAINSNWTRHVLTTTLGSVVGKTIGANSYLQFKLYWGPSASSASSFNFDIAGVQIELGSVPTLFSRATGTLQSELAACQRYYFRYGGNAVYEMFGSGQTWNNTNAAIQVRSPVTMRIPPTSVEYSTLYVGIYGAAGGGGVTSLTQLQGSRDVHLVQANVTPGNFTSNTFYQMFASNSTSAYIGFSAEL